MCIYTNDNEFRKADHDIPCVKIVRKYILNNGTVFYRSLYNFLATPINYHVNELVNMNKGRKVKDKLVLRNVKGDGVWHPCMFNGMRHFVDEGLHSFCPDADGVNDILKWGLEDIVEAYILNPKYDETGIVLRGEGHVEMAVLECVIPKGTMYVEGYHNCHVREDIASEHGYCSEALKVLGEKKLNDKNKLYVP